MAGKENITFFSQAQNLDMELSALILDQSPIVLDLQGSMLLFRELLSFSCQPCINETFTNNMKGSLYKLYNLNHNYVELDI